VSPEALRQFEEQVKQDEELEAFWLSLIEDVQVVILHLIKVPETKRWRGRAERALGRLCAFCDEHRLMIALVPSSAYGSSTERLVAWYRRHGFRSADEGGLMLRVPGGGLTR
jgi:hypothetical protein